VKQVHKQDTTDRLTLAIPPDAGYIAMARMFAASVARHMRCEEGSIEDVKIAISEACTNSVKAHRDSETNEPIQLLAHLEGEAVVFEIVDVGPGIDVVLHAAETDATSTPASGLYEGSLGLTLIRSLFPDAEILRNEDRGTTVRFSVPSFRDGVGDLDDLPELD
jgi:serine/threonine-protein kinase RsbW